MDTQAKGREARGGRGRAVMAAILLAAAVLAAPARAEARVTVSVQFAYGAVVVGGASIFIFIGGSWDMPLGSRDIPTALVEVSGERVRWGIPLLEPRPAPGRSDATEGVQTDLLRFRF